LHSWDKFLIYAIGSNFAQRQGSFAAGDEIPTIEHLYLVGHDISEAPPVRRRFDPSSYFAAGGLVGWVVG
jgi:hypothetical protein